MFFAVEVVGFVSVLKPPFEPSKEKEDSKGGNDGVFAPGAIYMSLPLKKFTTPQLDLVVLFALLIGIL